MAKKIIILNLWNGFRMRIAASLIYTQTKSGLQVTAVSNVALARVSKERKNKIELL